MRQENRKTDPIPAYSLVIKGQGMKRTADLKWQFSQVERSSYILRVPLERRQDWEFKILITSDQHWDNPKSNREMQIEHLDQAKAIGAPVMSAGDFFCLMQGTFDKRANKAALRPEHQTDN